MVKFVYSDSTMYMYAHLHFMLILMLKKVLGAFERRSLSKHEMFSWSYKVIYVCFTYQNVDVIMTKSRFTYYLSHFYIVTHITVPVGNVGFMGEVSLSTICFMVVHVNSIPTFSLYKLSLQEES